MTALIQHRERLAKELAEVRQSGGCIGLVPTMGFLHDGHSSLIARAVDECQVVVVTVFVNPLQFGAHEDLDSYPRDLDRDLGVASRAGAALVFVPRSDDVWPGGPPGTRIHPGALAQGLEGASRPGHFAGVATVVATLFNLVGPCRAYFGEKDFQQLAMVRRLAADLAFPVEVVGCATVREPDGLALSSRNVHLAAVERAAATVLHRALTGATAAIAGGERDASAVRRLMADTMRAEPLAVLDYAEAVDPTTLVPLAAITDGARLVVAARIGATRLIDNIGVSL